MSLLVSDVIDNARRLLQDTDEGGIRWIDEELVGWLNEAATEVGRINPASSARNMDMDLEAGTRQQVPSDGTQLLDVIRNVDAVTGDPGRIIRIVDRLVMDNERPEWHMEPPASQVKRYVFNDNDPMTFYVYPPNDGAGKATIVYSAAPVRVTQLTENLPVRDVFFAAICNYVCYRAWQKQIGDPESSSKATGFKNLFDQAMGERKAVMQEEDPNENSRRAY